MVSFLKPKREAPHRPAPRTTSLSFSAEDLADLGHLVAAGQAILQKRSPVIPRLKAAMTRLGVTPPKGL